MKGCGVPTVCGAQFLSGFNGVYTLQNIKECKLATERSIKVAKKYHKDRDGACLTKKEIEEGDYRPIKIIILNRIQAESFNATLISLGFKDVWQEHNPFSGSTLHFYILNVVNEENE